MKKYWFKNWDWLEHWAEVGNKLVDGRETMKSNWFKYGVVEHVGNDIIGGEISIKYRGRAHMIRIIDNELFVSYHSSQLKGSKFFSTTKKVHAKPFDKPYEQEELENILSVRTDIELINSYMICAEKIFRNWKVKQND